MTTLTISYLVGLKSGVDALNKGSHDFLQRMRAAVLVVDLM